MLPSILSLLDSPLAESFLQRHARSAVLLVCHVEGLLWPTIITCHFRGIFFSVFLLKRESVEKSSRPPPYLVSLEEIHPKTEEKIYSKL